ncbi:MAG: type II secretion system F family protein [Methylococcales bacterium]|nr:type II secretion system F family protein [Methylococcales bacterium]
MADLKKEKATPLKEYEFAWIGKDKARRKATGIIFATDEKKVHAELRKQGINVTKVRKKNASLFSKRIQKILPSDIAIFARQLATMLNAGVPVVQALDIVGRGNENVSMRDLLMSIKVDVESGDSLTQALRKHPAYFDELFCNLIEAGERAGVLESLLEKIATYKEKSESMKKKIKKALTYPVSVVIIAFIVTAVLLIFVVPVFEDLFKSFGADLPAFTKLVIAMSKWMQAYWWIIAAIITGAVYAFKFFKKTSEPFNYFLDKQILRTSVVGVIITKSAIARFARTLATMSAAGVPLVESLESAAGTCGNRVYKNAVLKIREEVAIGQRLQFAIQESGLFPHMVIQMIAIGEESGALDAMLSKVADFYEEEVDNLVDNLSSLMEPMIMMVLGVLVGGLIVAMYLPIFKLGSAIH